MNASQSNNFGYPASPYGAMPRQAQAQPSGLSPQEEALLQLMQQQGQPRQAMVAPLSPYARSADEEYLLQALKQGGFTQIDNEATFKKEEDRRADTSTAGAVAGMTMSSYIENLVQSAQDKNPTAVRNTFKMGGFDVLDDAAVATKRAAGEAVEQVIVNGQTYHIIKNPNSTIWQRLRLVPEQITVSDKALKTVNNLKRLETLKTEYVEHYLKQTGNKGWFKGNPSEAVMKQAEAYADAKVAAARAQMLKQTATTEGVAKGLSGSQLDTINDASKTAQQKLDEVVKIANVKGITAGEFKQGTIFTWFQRKLGWAGEAGIDRRLTGVANTLNETAVSGALKTAGVNADEVGKAVIDAAKQNSDDVAKAAAENVGTLGKAGKWLGEAAPWIGVAIEGGFAAHSVSQGNNKKAVAGLVDGMVIGNAMGSAGMLVGANIGTAVFPGVGTAIGALAGAVIGTQLAKSGAGQLGAGIGAAAGTLLIPIPGVGTVIGALAGGAIGTVAGKLFQSEKDQKKTLGTTVADFFGLTDKAEREGKQGEKQLQELQRQASTQVVPA